MSTEKLEAKPHSAEYFGESRDFWWNADFLELMGRRLHLAAAKEVLDVGCGIGHWGRILAPCLAGDARVTGVDREAVWVTKARERAAALGLGGRFRYEQGEASALPFKEGTFDLVTCQTVLIHLQDPRQCLREMLRVLKPGGLLLTVEPNNSVHWVIGHSPGEASSLEDALDRMRFGLTIERGKKALGLGFNSVGDLVPGYLAEFGAERIQVFLSDKAMPFIPPYSTKEQQVNIQQMQDWKTRGFIGWDREEARQYFLAGGGRENEFARCYQLLLEEAAKAIEAVDHRTYHTGGGAVTYLVSARKPSS